MKYQFNNHAELIRTQGINYFPNTVHLIEAGQTININELAENTSNTYVFMCGTQIVVYRDYLGPVTAQIGEEGEELFIDDSVEVFSLKDALWNEEPNDTENVVIPKQYVFQDENELAAFLDDFSPYPSPTPYPMQSGETISTPNANLDVVENTFIIQYPEPNMRIIAYRDCTGSISVTKAGGVSFAGNIANAEVMNSFNELLSYKIIGENNYNDLSDSYDYYYDSSYDS